MTTKTTPKTAPAPVQPSVRRGFPNLPCPFCSAEDSITVGLGEVTHFICDTCSTEFGPDDVARLIEAWTHVLVWIDQAPRLEDPAK